MKVEIKITKGNYVKSVKGGVEFTSVNYSGKTYGGSSPCDNPDEINRAIKWARERIIEEGDKPVLVDERERAKLTAWGF